MIIYKKKNAFTSGIRQDWQVCSDWYDHRKNNVLIPAFSLCKSWLMKGRKAYGTCENPTPARICVCMCVTVKYHNMRFNVKQIGVPIHGESDVLWITLRLYKSKLSSLIGKDFYNLFSPHFRVLPFPSA